VPNFTKLNLLNLNEKYYFLFFFERKNILENNQLMYVLINRAMYLKNSGCQSRLTAICASLSLTENPDEFAYFKSLHLGDRI
jgi:hypothetical protein